MTSSSSPVFEILSPEASDVLGNIFAKYTDTFGIRTYATTAVSDSKLLHASRILAEYLDNNEDGIIDSQLIVQELIENKATMVIFKDESEQDSFELEAIEQTDINFQNLFDHEIHINGATEGIFDASLEEILHLISDYGYAEAYPDAFSVTSESLLTKAMDIARGGHFLEVPLAYPEDAWFTYNDDTADYSSQAAEYLYWGLTSYLGGQDFPGRKEQIEDEWKLNTRELLESTDLAFFDLITGEKYQLPSTLPDGVYGQDSISSVAIHRLYNSILKKHLFSSNTEEINGLTSGNNGWLDEGIAYYSPLDTDATLDVYRFYVSSEDRHFYTANTSERDLIMASKDLSHYNYEGVAYQAYGHESKPDGAIGVVRYYNTISNSHLYSTNIFEQEILDADKYWINEGIAWYGDLA